MKTINEIWEKYKHNISGELVEYKEGEFQWQYDGGGDDYAEEFENKEAAFEETWKFREELEKEGYEVYDEDIPTNYRYAIFSVRKKIIN